MSTAASSPGARGRSDGSIRWTFHTISGPGEAGHETWPPDASKTAGGANAWSGMSVDHARGLVFLPTGSPAWDFWGGDRHGENLFGNCVLALRAETCTLNAIDLDLGEIRWSVPLGEVPELTRRGLAPTGTENYGGPIVTAGGLVFVGATRDERIRAFDKRTGTLLWEAPLPAGGYATPATYEAGGRQYVVIAAGGGTMGTRSGDAYVAFALPE